MATSLVVQPDPPAIFPGGLLALTSNSGSFSKSDWGVVPEAAVRVGYQVTEGVGVYVGYSFLLWPSVYRAVEQIDPVVNPDLLPPPVTPLTGPVRPLFPGHESSLWVQTISLGAELRY